MANSRIAELMTELIATDLGIEPERVTPSAKIADLVAESGGDELDFQELTWKVEENFNVSLPTDDSSTLRTVELWRNHLKTKKLETVQQWIDYTETH